MLSGGRICRMTKPLRILIFTYERRRKKEGLIISQIIISINKIVNMFFHSE